ncbi:MAG: hypothetical protein KGJ90_03920 [Patescibacteria group bacterium]|nr:hypothetical protein [Patescibacteria group bacterium]
MSHKKLIISNSTLHSFASCETKGILHTMGYCGEPSEANPKLMAGKCAHLCLEAWLQGKSPDECLQVFTDSYKHFSDTYIPDKGKFSQLRWENLTKILSTYLALNPLNAMDFDVVETERQVLVELYSDSEVTILFSDKMDGKVRMHASGALASMEHKTGEWMDDEWFNRYDMDGQITGHIVAASVTENATIQNSGESVGSVIVNAIQFNQIPDLNDPTKRKKNGDFKSCSTHHIPLDQCVLDHVKWARREFSRSLSDITLWRLETVRQALAYYHMLQDTGNDLVAVSTIPMRGLLNGHCARCEFKPFCASGKRNQGYLMKQPPRDDAVLSSGLYNA